MRSPVCRSDRRLAGAKTLNPRMNRVDRRDRHDGRIGDRPNKIRRWRAGFASAIRGARDCDGRGADLDGSRVGNRLLDVEDRRAGYDRRVGASKYHDDRGGKNGHECFHRVFVATDGGVFSDDKSPLPGFK